MDLPSPGLLAAIVDLGARFSNRTSADARILRYGQLLPSSLRTVSNFLRKLGLDDDRQFVRIHHMLNLAPWSALMYAAGTLVG